MSVFLPASSRPAELILFAVCTGSLRQAMKRWVSLLLFAYGLSGTAGAGQLINLSTRGFVGTDDNVLIGGFIIEGTPTRVLLRAPGPSLSAVGVSGVLADPTLELFFGQTRIASNDDWQTSSQAAEITQSGLAPAHPREAAIPITLNPGAYTAIVRGAGGTIGVALVEVFLLAGTDI
jgi:hypothetical protein